MRRHHSLTHWERRAYVSAGFAISPSYNAGPVCFLQALSWQPALPACPRSEHKLMTRFLRSLTTRPEPAHVALPVACSLTMTIRTLPGLQAQNKQVCQQTKTRLSSPRKALISCCACEPSGQTCCKQSCLKAAAQRLSSSASVTMYRAIISFGTELATLAVHAELHPWGNCGFAPLSALVQG